MSADICSMRILLIAATRMEIAPVVDWLKRHDNQAGTHIIITGYTGIGGMMTGWWLGRHLDEIRPQLVIQAGVAGSFSKNWDPAQPYLVGRDHAGDLGVWENGEFRTAFDLKLLHPDLPPFLGGWLPNPHKEYMVQTGLPVVDSTTVNLVSTEPRDIKRLSALGAKLETMEGAALHYACIQAGIPFLQIRTVCNEVGERNKQDWRMAEAIQHLNDFLIEWLPSVKLQQL